MNWKIVHISMIVVFVALCLVSSSNTLKSVDEFMQNGNKHGVKPQRSMFNNMPASELKALLREMVGSRQQKYCEIPFSEPQAKIIKAKDSIRNGATFLVVTDSEILGAEKCRNDCCSYSSGKCDLALFQKKSQTKDPKCFLFQCYNESSDEYSCLFDDHDGYIAFSKMTSNKIGDNEEELVEVGSEISDVTTAVPTHEKLTTKPVQTTRPVLLPVTSVALRLNDDDETTKMISSAKPVCTKKCSRFQWQCDNHCCISIRNVCNGVVQCEDKSDEIGCPTISTQTIIPQPNIKSKSDVESSAKEDKVNNLITKASKDFNLSKVGNSQLLVHKATEADRQLKQDEISLEINQTFPTEVNSATFANLLGDKKHSDPEIFIVEDDRTVNTDSSIILPLAIGLAVTLAILVVIVCRIKVMKSKLKRKGRPLSMDESDYLINGMYL